MRDGRFASELRWRWRSVTAGLRALPDALIIGAQKAGTTSLFHYLRQHPQLLPPLRKEVHYFDLNHHRGEGWYRAHFPLRRQLGGGRITLEASPFYLFHPAVPARIAELLPRARLIAILRDPTERALSQYHAEVRKGRETLPLAEALRQEERRLSGQGPDTPGFAQQSYKRRGHYAEQLERYLALFPAEQLLVLTSDELFSHPEATLRRCFEFLGLDPAVRVPDLRARNAGGGGRQVDEFVRRELDAYFLPHNARLQRLLGRDLPWGG